MKKKSRQRFNIFKEIKTMKEQFYIIILLYFFNVYRLLVNQPFNMLVSG